MRLILALESENFPAQRRALRAPGLPPADRLGSPVVPPRELLRAAGGALLLVDWGEGRVVTRLDLPMPSGLAWPDPEGPLWVACQFPPELRQIDPASGHTVGVLRHPAFNDLHRVVARPGGGVIVVSSGAECVLAFDEGGAEVWSCWLNPARDRDHNYNSVDIPTLSRLVHPISVAALGPGRALVTSFHEGTIQELGPEARPRLWFEGLRQPHGLVATPEGWLVADTGRGRALRLDPAMGEARVLSEGHRWLQDLAPTASGGAWALENKDFRGGALPSGGPRLIELDPEGRALGWLELSPEWRLGAMLPLDAARAGRLRWPEVKVRARRGRAGSGGTARG